MPDFKGVIHCDAGAVFNRIGTRDGVTLSDCHAHARRKFEQIEKASGKGKAKLAVEALRLYRRLYDIERYATDNDLAAAQIYTLRQEKSKPILDEFYTWLTQSQAKTLPKSPIGMAYYEDILKRIPLCKTLDDYSALLPWHWEKEPSLT